MKQRLVQLSLGLTTVGLTLGLALLLSCASGQERRPDVIFVPTPQPVVERMLELAKVTKADVVYDLGCGDGRIVVTAAKKYGCKAVGFDIDPVRVKESLENVRKNGVEDLVKIEQKDIFTLDLSGASVITLYLLTSLNEKLVPQLQKMKPGSRIVSHSFEIPGYEPDKVERVDADGFERTVYLYTIPLRKKAQQE
ncbi:MAG: methyltransferase domain-containing protein [Gemmatales bacterium]|nr:methyltransferase domain-containing protein [Gemmatales bacterium]MDW8175551.1 methyltransferase domain-containing protein [Gemmatales bacterium]